MKRFEHRADELTERRHAVAVANSAGAEGWELVSVVQSASSVHHVDLYFKRELPPRQPTAEQVRTVRERAQVSMQDARAALVATECDVDRAVVRVAQVDRGFYWNDLVVEQARLREQHGSQLARPDPDFNSYD